MEEVIEKATVLVVDDERGPRESLRMILSPEHRVLQACSGAEALEILGTEQVDLATLDLNMPGIKGEELMRTIRGEHPMVEVIVITGCGTLESAAAGIRSGICDYLQKPWDDDKLVAGVRNLLRMRALEVENRRLKGDLRRARDELAERYDLRGLVYASSAMHEVVSLAVRVARADVPVLITGANGTGKEKLAEVLQANSPRRGGPFVKVNAGGLPESLLEAELFGAEAGAYTGAGKRRVGRFEAADGGTLLLDEIGELDLAVQGKLLRALQAVADKINARIIGEGLDTLEELETLERLGICFGQGWLFGKPHPLRSDT